MASNPAPNEAVTPAVAPAPKPEGVDAELFAEYDARIKAIEATVASLGKRVEAALATDYTEFRNGVKGVLKNLGADIRKL